jgi:hypothetical protein
MQLNPISGRYHYAREGLTISTNNTAFPNVFRYAFQTTRSFEMPLSIRPYNAGKEAEGCHCRSHPFLRSTPTCNSLEASYLLNSEVLVPTHFLSYKT